MIVPSQIREIIARNRRIIVIAVAIAAISSYLIPFDKLMGANEAQGAKCPFPGINGLLHGQGLKYGIKKHINCQVDDVKGKVKDIKDGLSGTGSQSTSKPSDTSKSSSKPDTSSKQSQSNPSNSVKDHVSKAIDKVKSKTSSKPSDTSKSSSKPSDTSKSSSKPSDTSKSSSNSVKDHVSKAIDKVKSKTSSKP